MPILSVAILMVVAIIVLIVVGVKTKSWKKVGYSLEIILSLVVFILSTKLPQLTTADQSLFVIIILLGAGLLINGIVSLLKE